MYWISLVYAAYLVGHLNAWFSKSFIQTWLTDEVIGKPHKILLDEVSGQDVKRKIFRNYYRALDKLTIQRIRIKGIGLYDGQPSEEQLEALGVCVRNYAKNSQATWNLMETFIAQYGFFRNTCGALVISSALLLLDWIVYGRCGHVPLIFLILVIAVTLFYRYLKFYRLYHYEMYSAFPDIQIGG